MFDPILFPTDGSEAATTALEHVLDVAAGHDATVHLLNVVDTAPDSVVDVTDAVLEELDAEGERIVTHAADRANDRGVPTITRVQHGDPYRAILDYAETQDIALIALPTHGRRGLQRLMLGSTTERVLRRATTPVLTIRPTADAPPSYPYREVLVPTDGSRCARAALDLGIDVVDAEAATLHLLTVVDALQLGVDVRTDLQLDLLEEAAHQIVEDATDHAASAGIDSLAGTVEVGSSIHGAIRDYVDDHDIDLVVTGTHGRSGLDRYLLGSVAETLIRTAPVPVLAVRAAEDDS